MPKIKIERTNKRIHGHNGYGRYNILGRVVYDAITENQAATIIGRGIIQAYRKYCTVNDVDINKEGVILQIEFERYTPKITE